jgi:hypothetical protein
MKRVRIANLAGALIMTGGCSAGAGSATPPQALAAAPAPAAGAPAPAAGATFAPWAAAGPPLWSIPTGVSYIGPPLPEDVANGIALYQPYLDQFSWQMFIAVNWPACRADSKGCRPGDPDKSRWIGAGADAPTVWEHWMNADDVFRKGGAPPIPWGSQDIPPACNGKVQGDRSLVFTMSDGSATSHNDPSLKGYLQFDERATGPLIDQRRRWARFESYLNEAAYRYIVDSKLYSLEGQKAFAASSSAVHFPPRPGDPSSSIELKAVWKILDEKEDRSRYHTANGLFVDATGACSSVPVGLAAMHIMAKIERNPMRVWATFEHVDNLCRFVYQNDKGYEYTSGSFCDAACRDNPRREGCAPNQPPSLPWVPPARPGDPGDRPPTQVVRVRPLPLGSVQINSLMSTFLAGIDSKSVWQNYQLVSTQWVLALLSDLNSTVYREYLTLDRSGPAPQYIPRIKGEDRCNQHPMLLGNDPACVGLVVPPILGNSLIETYNQAGSSCLGCHQQAKSKFGLNLDFSFVLSRAQ